MRLCLKKKKKVKPAFIFVTFCQLGRDCLYQVVGGLFPIVLIVNWEDPDYPGRHHPLGREELGDRMGVTSTSSASSFALPLTPFLTKKMEPEITGRGSGSLGGRLRGLFPCLQLSHGAGDRRSASQLA